MQRQPHEEYWLKAWQYNAGPYTAIARYNPMTGFDWVLTYEGESGFFLYAKGESRTLREARRQALERLEALQYNVLIAQGKLNLMKGGELRWNALEQHHGR